MSEPESDSEMVEVIGIYVLPSMAGLPPRALLMSQEDMEASNPEEGSMRGNLTIWSADMGCWVLGPGPVSPELGERITEHAKSLGVKW